MNKVIILICTIVTFGFASNAFARQYFVSSTGNDVNSGNSITEAWLTIEKVRAHAWFTGFTAGDTILFEGGRTFITKNGIYIQCDKTYGTTENPVTFSSFGIGRAILRANGCHMFQAWAPPNGAVQLGLEFTNLIIEGNGIPIFSSINTNGIYVWNGSNSDIDYLHIENVEIKGFAGNGIETGRDLDKGVISGITIRNVVTHHNPGAVGVSPHTGSGIVVGGADSAIIEHCISHNNGTNNNNSGGPIGIWLWDNRNSIIQHCESYENKTILGDGGGFDLDGGCQNCIIQYSYSHNNDGAGFLLAQFEGANLYGPLEGNIIRYNISENDGRKSSYGGITFWGANSIDKVGANYVYNNTVYMGGAPTNGIPSCVGFIGENMNGIKICNNIFFSDDNLNIINSYYAFLTSEVFFQNNVYYAAQYTPFVIKWPTTFNSLSEWRSSANGQEMNESNPLGIQTNPMVVDAGHGNTINNTSTLSSLNAYRLSANSPLIDAAADLSSAPFFLSHLGLFDFYGNTLPVGGYYDYGAHDTTKTVDKPIQENTENHLAVFPNPVHHGKINIRSSSEILSITIINFLGQIKGSYWVNNLMETILPIDLLSGIYILRVLTREGEQIKRILVL